MKKITRDVIDSFKQTPDDYLIHLAMNDWEMLFLVCYVLTLDIQLTYEKY
jgi:hypothetical protein